MSQHSWSRLDSPRKLQNREPDSEMIVNKPVEFFKLLVAQSEWSSLRHPNRGMFPEQMPSHHVPEGFNVKSAKVVGVPELFPCHQSQALEHTVAGCPRRDQLKIDSPRQLLPHIGQQVCREMKNQDLVARLP